jgi:hypothetical protein
MRSSRDKSEVALLDVPQRHREPAVRYVTRDCNGVVDVVDVAQDR